MADVGVALLEEISLDTWTAPTPTGPRPVSDQPPKVHRMESCACPLIDVESSPSSFSLTENFRLHRRSRQERVRGQDYFSQVADEVVLHIFRWLHKPMLSNCAKVCKRWRRLAYDESLWKRLDLGGKHLCAGALGHVLKRGVAVLRLSKAEVTGPIFLDAYEAFKDELSLRHIKLQYLDLGMSLLSPSDLGELLSSCRQLRRLSLEHCRLNDDVCRQLSANSELEHLNLCMSENLTACGLESILRGCNKLEALNVAWSTITTESCAIMAKTLSPSIRRLNLAGCRNFLTDSLLEELCARCTKLCELDASDATQITGLTIQIVLKHLPHLQKLSLSRCYNIPPISYLALQPSTSLKHLEIFGLLHEPALYTLRRSLPDIEINCCPFSTVARPTTGVHRTSLWGLRVRD